MVFRPQMGVTGSAPGSPVGAIALHPLAGAKRVAVVLVRDFGVNRVIAIHGVHCGQKLRQTTEGAVGLVGGSGSQGGRG